MKKFSIRLYECIKAGVFKDDDNEDNVPSNDLHRQPFS